MSSIIRLADEHDSNVILEIYEPFIKNTSITFENIVPSEKEFIQRMRKIQQQYPYLVYEINQKVVGYAYADMHSDREAYKWSVHYSVYVEPNHQSKGIGKRLYNCMTKILKLQGYYNAYAVISTPNIQSENFHKAFGFNLIGIMKNAGFKLGKWHDVSWYYLPINKIISNPMTPKTIRNITNIQDIINETKEY